MIRRLRLLLPTVWRLGLSSVARVIWYRVGCRCGIYRWLMPVRSCSDEASFFHAAPLPPPDPLREACGYVVERAEGLLRGEYEYFSSTRHQVGNPPRWFVDPFSVDCRDHGGHWSVLDEFTGGDIKTIWELSRFDWVPLFGCAWRLTADNRYLEALNRWLSDWARNNPANSAPNWKCGQEAAIRVMHLAMTALMLKQTQSPVQGVQDLLQAHLQRIGPTVGYALAQDNNHGTSEAAALYLGGSWLSLSGNSEGKRWQRLGRKQLEKLAARLIETDGSFSQYSVNYHRVLLDTLCMVEVWRRRHGLAEFSTRWQMKAAAAANWLRAMVDADTGDAPVLGANDGARLLPLTADYRDHRSSVQLATVLFCGGRAYGDAGAWDNTAALLGVELPDRVVEQPQSLIFREGGYALLRRDKMTAILRFPRFRFRPGHADALHLDLWLGGQNLLRDAGSYSYNCPPDVARYFSGTAGHNTVQFDGRDQMPRLGRFLFGRWLRTASMTELTECQGELSFAAGYRDAEGASHLRTVRLSAQRLVVVDEVAGFADRAVLRWRVRPGAWRLTGDTLSDGVESLSVSASVPLARVELISGWESRHYQQKAPVPVLEVEMLHPGTITTEYYWRT